MNVTLNDNCRSLAGYPACIVGRKLLTHFFLVHVPGIKDPLCLTPGHFAEEDAVVDKYNL